MTNKILHWCFKRASLPYWCIVFLDSIAFMLSGLLTFYLFRRGIETISSFWSLNRILLVYLAVSMVFYKLFNTYSSVLRYSSFVDLARVGYANFFAMIMVIMLHYWVFKWPVLLFAHLHGREIICLYVLATVLMGSARVIVKIIFDVTTSDKRALKSLIYGVADGGIGIAKNIRSQKPTRFLLRGFIAQDEQFLHHQLMGENVYHSLDDISKAIKKRSIEAVLVSPLRNRDFRSNQSLQDLLISQGVKIFMVQNAEEWNGKDGIDDIQLKEVQVEDLLPREEIKVDMGAVAEQLQGKRVLVTGSAGSIGSEIVRQVAACMPKAMLLIDQAETPQHDISLMMGNRWKKLQAVTIVTDICREERMDELFREFRPDIVFHAAAYKHVPMMEDNPREAVLNNIVGTKIIADLSVKYGAKKFVMISTDKAVNPTNVMGCSKRICEIYVQSLNNVSKSTQFVTTRFGNVLGSNGSVIPLFREQIKRGGPVTVTHPDIIRYFMLIPEACQLVLEAGTKGSGGEIFVFDMGEPVRISDLAKRMIQLSGAKGVEIRYTGLRAGEKLYEEVLNELENTKPSFHEKIRIAEVRQYDFAEVSKEIDELVDVSRKADEMAVVKKMKKIVPEYKSNNSKYEVLDK